MNCSQNYFDYEVGMTLKIGLFMNNLISKLTILPKLSPKELTEFYVSLMLHQPQTRADQQAPHL